MKTKYFIILFLLISTIGNGQPGNDFPIQPVPFYQVKLNEGFWLTRMQTNRKITIPFGFKKCEETGRIENFSNALKGEKNKVIGVYPFDDTDIYKIIEGASYSLSLFPDPVLDKYLDSLITLIAGAQEEDGYLYTWRTIGMDSMDSKKSDLCKINIFRIVIVE